MKSLLIFLFDSLPNLCFQSTLTNVQYTFISLFLTLYRYSVSPLSDVNFGCMVITNRRTSSFTIENNGDFEFRYCVSKRLSPELQKMRQSVKYINIVHTCTVVYMYTYCTCHCNYMCLCGIVGTCHHNRLRLDSKETFLLLPDLPQLWERQRAWETNTRILAHSGK